MTGFDPDLSLERELKAADDPGDEDALDAFLTRRGKAAEIVVDLARRLVASPAWPVTWVDEFQALADAVAYHDGVPS